MAVLMPEADSAVLDRRAEIVAALRAIVPGEGVIDTPVQMRAYESDGLTAYRQPPMVVVLSDTTEQVAKVLKYCHEQGIKVVPRGSGTSLSARRCRTPASTTRPIRHRRSPARSAATSRKIPAACIA